MRIEVLGAASAAERRAIERLVRRVARAEKCRARELSVVLVGNAEIRRLNRRFLGRDRTTDVMAFPISDELLGEVHVSRDQARIQARRYGVSLRSEILRLVLHGLLHLLGDTHQTMRPKYGRYLESP
jgi:probable rRNA maturation factor